MKGKGIKIKEIGKIEIVKMDHNMEVMEVDLNTEVTMAMMDPQEEVVTIILIIMGTVDMVMIIAKKKDQHLFRKIQIFNHLNLMKTENLYL